MPLWYMLGRQMAFHKLGYNRPAVNEEEETPQVPSYPGEPESNYEPTTATTGNKQDISSIWDDHEKRKATLSISEYPE